MSRKSESLPPNTIQIRGNLDLRLSRRMILALFGATTTGFAGYPAYRWIASQMVEQKKPLPTDGEDQPRQSKTKKSSKAS